MWTPYRILAEASLSLSRRSHVAVTFYDCGRFVDVIVVAKDINAVAGHFRTFYDSHAHMKRGRAFLSGSNSGQDYNFTQLVRNSNFFRPRA
jgi:hypothetical protein